MSKKASNSPYNDIHDHYQHHEHYAHRQDGGAKRRQSARTERARREGAYVNANYRFGLSERNSVGPFLNDPERMPEWDAIVHVSCFENFEEYVCPVCLHTPAAPRITRCGHVYCLPCIMQYLDHQDSKTCPMCSKNVSLPQLRPLQVIPIVRKVVGDVVHFTLLRRGRSSVVPELVAQPEASPEARAPCMPVHLPDYHAPVAVYSSYSVCSAEDLLQHATLEAEQLRNRLQALQGDATPGSELEREWLSRSFDLVQQQAQSQFYDSDAPPCSPVSPVLSAGPGSGPRPEEEYAFFMATDGQPIFLCTLNIWMLLAAALPEKPFAQGLNAFAELAAALRQGAAVPSTFECPIVQIDRFTQTEESKRRLKHLGHLPLCTSFQVVEVDLSGVVPAPVIARFADQLEQRADTRRRHLHQQQREDHERDRRHRQEVEARKAQRLPLPARSDFPVLYGEAGTEGEFEEPDQEDDVRPEAVPAKEPPEPRALSLAEIMEEQKGGQRAWGASGAPICWGPKPDVGVKVSTPPGQSFADILKAGRSGQGPGPGPFAGRGKVLVAGAAQPAAGQPEEAPYAQAIDQLLSRAQKAAPAEGKRGKKGKTVSLTSFNMAPR